MVDAFIGVIYYITIRVTLPKMEESRTKSKQRSITASLKTPPTSDPVPDIL
jgi:hypothetical protein